MSRDAAGTDPDAPAAPRSRPDRSGPGLDERTPNTAFNALIGGVVTAATALFVPLSPALGGAVAGYLEGGGTDAGLKVGALSGLVALVPLLLLVPVVLLFVPVVGPRGAAGLLVVAAFAALLVAAYTVGLGAVGGVLGAYLEREF